MYLYICSYVMKMFGSVSAGETWYSLFDGGADI